MKIAIHYFPGSFSNAWISYCDQHKIRYKLVDCYQSDILSQLAECDGLLWHWVQTDYRSMLFAKQFTFAVEKMGLKCFPDIHTAWHFDDKVGQKYLLEAIDAPLVPTHVFYSKTDALDWLKTAKFPKVFKLRGGAGSVNVSLVKNKVEAGKLIRKAFGKGFKHINRKASFKDKIVNFQNKLSVQTGLGVLKGLGRFVIPTEEEKMSGKEKGYIYFQDYIPDNEYDIRLTVIGDRCVAVRRYNRKNDFRASGSGKFKFEPELFDIESIKLAFELTEKLNMQSCAFDFVKKGGKYLLIEISYCFPVIVPNNLQGYWDKDLKWHHGQIIPEHFMIEDLINSIRNVGK